MLVCLAWVVFAIEKCAVRPPPVVGHNQHWIVALFVRGREDESVVVGFPLSTKSFNQSHSMLSVLSYSSSLESTWLTNNSPINRGRSPRCGLASPCSLKLSVQF